MDLHTSPTRHLTYLGQRAQVREVSRSKSGRSTGERVVVTQWIDDAKGQAVEHPAGTIAVRHVKGDGRTDTFVEYSVHTFIDLGQAMAAANEIMQGTFALA